MRTARDYARAIVTAETLADKLVPPGELALEDPEPALRLPAPGRPANLAIVPGRNARVPPIAGMPDPNQRARILHALANHELQAIELFAWALLAFPDAPTAFRRGLVAILADEQRHLASMRSGWSRSVWRSGTRSSPALNKLDHLGTSARVRVRDGLHVREREPRLRGDYAAAKWCVRRPRHRGRARPGPRGRSRPRTSATSGCSSRHTAIRAIAYW